MKTQLILALTLSVLAANTFAADGYDRTGSAAYTSEAAVASDGYDHTGSASFAAMAQTTLALANSRPTALIAPVPPASPPMALITSVQLA